MAISLRGIVGTSTSNTSSTTFTITTAIDMVAGDLLVIGICCDNTSGTAPTISNVTSNNALGDAVHFTPATAYTSPTATAAASVRGRIAWFGIGNSVPSGTVLTITVSVAVVAKVAVAAVFAGVIQPPSAMLTSATGTSTTGVPVATHTAALVAGDLLVGTAEWEDGTTPPTLANNATGGSWVNVTSANIGTGAAGVSIRMQYKVVNTSGSSWALNPTGVSADAAAEVAAFQQAPSVSTPRPVLKAGMNPAVRAAAVSGWAA